MLLIMLGTYFSSSNNTFLFIYFAFNYLLEHGPWESSQGLLAKINHKTYPGHKGLNFLFQKEKQAFQFNT